MSIKAGDLVRVLYCPSPCFSNWPSMVGYVGVVHEVHEKIGRVLVQTFTNEGDAHRLAFIDVKALEVVWSAEDPSEQSKSEKEQSDYE